MARKFPANGCCSVRHAVAVDQIIGSYKAISMEGGFKIGNLMIVRDNDQPTSV